MKLENIIKSVNVCETKGTVDKEIKVFRWTLVW